MASFASKVSWAALLPLLVVYLIWGTTLGTIRMSVETLPWAMVPCSRFLIAGSLLMVISLGRREGWPGWPEVRKHVIAGLLLFTGGNSIVCWAVQYMTTGLSGLVVATLPFWIIGLSAILPPKEKITQGTIISILISFTGMLILLSPHLQNPAHNPPLFWWAVLAMLINTIFWALGSVFIRKNPSNVSRCMSVSIQTLSAGLSLIPVCLFTIPQGTVIHPSTQTLLALLYLIVFGTGIATPCYLYVVKNLPIAISSTFAYVTPVITLIFGYFFLKEQISPLTIVGVTIILSGVIVAQILSLRETRQKAALASLMNSTPLEITTPVVLEAV